MHELDGLGIPPDRLGYRYLVAAIGFAVDTPEYLHAVTTKLYPEVAKEFSTKPDLIERSVRTAIHAGCERAGEGKYREYFGNACKKSAKPTNSEFIAGIANKLRNAEAPADSIKIINLTEGKIKNEQRYF